MDMKLAACKLTLYIELGYNGGMGHGGIYDCSLITRYHNVRGTFFATNKALSLL